MTRLADGRKTINLARSADGGLSWRVWTNLQPTMRTHVIADPFAHDTLYAGTNEGFAILRSTDGGAFWSPYWNRADIATAARRPHPAQPGDSSPSRTAACSTPTMEPPGRRAATGARSHAIDEPSWSPLRRTTTGSSETTNALHWTEIVAPDCPSAPRPYWSLPSIGAPPVRHRYARAPRGHQLRQQPGDVDESRFARRRRRDLDNMTISGPGSRLR
jgi:hypothetical protein